MVYLYGASGHAKVIADIINSKLTNSILGVFDDDLSINHFIDLPFLGRFDKSKINKGGKLVICIGDNLIRKNVSKELDNNSFFVAIHDSSVISNNTIIKEGTVVMANAIVNSASTIGKHCIINTASIVEHDCIIEDYVHISPNATLTGGVKIGEGSHIGAGAIILPNITIGKWCKIGAGTVVLKNIPDNSVVVGNPGKVIKTLN
ncbi:acetyltransferase [Lacinutrix mariniflava]|uniref:acetyltransferase n=1 Tax=Lacinutrix mariniflava TaxID=342955 RepID=UPI0006E2268C|nr:acetyltransferase [Lacinutrix mariniflava]